MSLPPPEPNFGAPLPPQASPDTLRLLALRRSSSAQTLRAPAPDEQALADLLRLAARAPDHGKMTPWRFVVLRDPEKARFVEGLEAIAAARPDAAKTRAALVKIATPPLTIAVISAPRLGGKPVREQVASAAAVCTLMLVAAEAMGYGANWITDWYGEDAQALRLLGVDSNAAAPEALAGWIMIGSSDEAPLERVRPAVEALTRTWTPAQAL